MKLKLKKKRKCNVFTILIFIIILGLFLSYQLIKYFSDKAMPIFLSYAESETRKLTTLIINKAVTKQITNDMDVEDLFTVVKNNAGEIILIDFNSKNVTKILNSITNLVQLNLKAIEEGNIDLIELPDNTLDGYDDNLLRRGIIYEIPVGVISQSSFLGNLGPKIPVKLNLIGDVITGINTDVREYGINNALIDVNINIEVTTRINLPFVSNEITVNNKIPIATKVIQGQIPNYYLGGFSSNSNILKDN